MKNWGWLVVVAMLGSLTAQAMELPRNTDVDLQVCSSPDSPMNQVRVQFAIGEGVDIPSGYRNHTFQLIAGTCRRVVFTTPDGRSRIQLHFISLGGGPAPGTGWIRISTQYEGSRGNGVRRTQVVTHSPAVVTWNTH